MAASVGGGPTEPTRSRVKTSPSGASVAERLGLTEAELKAARGRHDKATSAVTGLAKEKRSAAVARSLGVSVDGLRAFRGVLGGEQDSKRAALAKVVAHELASGGPHLTSIEILPRLEVASPRRSQISTDSSGARRNGPRPPATSNAVRDGLARLGQQGRKKSQKLTERDFYVADFSQKVHIKASCHGLLRGFKSSNEPDSRVFTVKLGKRHCAGMQACKKCINDSMQRQVDATISKLHGTAGPSATTKRKKRRRS